METDYPEVFRSLPQPLHENNGTYLKIGHYSHYPYSFTFTLLFDPHAARKSTIKKKKRANFEGYNICEK
jgi:hypothetical protein